MWERLMIIFMPPTARPQQRYDHREGCTSTLAVDFFTAENEFAAAPLRPLLHRVGQPARASGRLHAESERAIGSFSKPANCRALERAEPLRGF